MRNENFDLMKILCRIAVSFLICENINTTAQLLPILPKIMFIIDNLNFFRMHLYNHIGKCFVDGTEYSQISTNKNVLVLLFKNFSR